MALLNDDLMLASIFGLQSPWSSLLLPHCSPFSSSVVCTSDSLWILFIHFCWFEGYSPKYFHFMFFP